MFIGLESAVQASKGGKKPIVLPSCDPYEPQQWSAWQDIPKGVTVAYFGGNQQLPN